MLSQVFNQVEDEACLTRRSHTPYFDSVSFSYLKRAVARQTLKMGRTFRGRLIEALIFLLYLMLELEIHDSCSFQ